MEDVEAFIAHYASQYYDPVKAHEYYERTKKLKGRKTSNKKLTSKQQTRLKQTEAMAYVRNQISTKKKAAQENTKKSTQAKLEKLQTNAQEARDRIVEKLTELVEQLQQEVAGTKLNTISPNASPALRAYLERSNRRKANNALQKAGKTSATAQQEAREQIQKVGTDLKEAVTKAREDYAKAQKALQEKYAKALVTETKNIQKKVR